MDLHAQSLYVVGTVGSASEIGEVELDLVPALIQSHGHGTNEGLDTRGRLIIGSPEPSPNTLIVQDLDLEGEVFLQVLDDHNQEGQLDGQRLLGVERSIDVVGRYVRTHDFQDGRLDVGIRDSLDVAVSHTLVPDLQWFRSKHIRTY